MGLIKALWKWGVIFCTAVAWLCQARAISDLYENLPITTRVGMKGINRGKMNHNRCIESFAKMQDPAFANVLGYPAPIGNYNECEKTKLFQPENKTSDVALTTHLCLGSYEESHMKSAMFSPPFGAICVPEECGPHELKSEEFFEWITTIAFNQSMQQPGILNTGTQYLANTWKFTKLVDEWRMALLAMLVLWATVQDLITPPDFPFQNSNSNLLGCHEERMSTFMTAFSITRNVNRLFTVRGQNELSVFEGMKVLSIMWVILGHLMAFQASSGYYNPEAVSPPNGILSRMGGQFFFSARFAVDTFFFLSGFLVVYVMLMRYSNIPELQHCEDDQERSTLLMKGDGKARVVSTQTTVLPQWHTWIPFFYLHRILRILPSYMFCLLLWWKVAVFMGTGPLWYRWNTYIELCDKYWWTNLTFINNFVPWQKGEQSQCFFHTWYLANDMQFYIVSPLFIVIYAKHRIFGILTLTLSLITSIVAMVWGTVERNWSALSFDGTWSVAYDEETYTMPWFRIVPYLFGMGFAIYWHEEGQKLSAEGYKMSSVECLACRCSAVGIFIFICFVGHSGYTISPCQATQSPDTELCGSGWSLLRRVLYNSLTRPAWCIALILFCIPCFHNQGGITQQLLNRRSWVPFARLSFLAYLLHPVVINLWMLNQKSKFNFTRLNFFMTYIGVCTVTFGCSLLVNLLVESPITIFGKYLEHWLRQSCQREQNNGGEYEVEYEAALQSPSSGGGKESNLTFDSSGEFLGTRKRTCMFEGETGGAIHTPYQLVETP